MKKITLPFCLFFCCFFGFSQGDLVGETWRLHYMEIDGNIINVAPTQGINSAGIVFAEPSSNYYEFQATAGDINYAFNSGNSLTFGTGNFTADFVSVTLGNCLSACTLESQYLYTIMSGSNSSSRVFDYEIIDQGNGEKLLIIDTPEGNRAVHGNFVLSVEKFQKKNIVMYPNPVKKKLYFDFKGFSPEKINILSLVGSSIFEAKVSHQQNAIDLSFLSPGIYFMKTTYKDGDTTVSRFLKE
ncbi:T9SS type A sorting domain-containing protein [Kordia algicida OT-1]|uniref:Secretion system C-terminal sorting domain-containing protein n=1 Tax=Kordia algicida OT-1 TaxID=391587 RepID=A9E2H4_9FLAO|nr:T9SS type A sorting domain-containing protein [Kordia algicida]EDP95390.1 hypothetical protein KAOT1_10721 [Kordia algicida OT-1]